jgi:hypothetical protein
MPTIIEPEPITAQPDDELAWALAIEATEHAAWLATEDEDDLAVADRPETDDLR